MPIYEAKSSNPISFTDATGVNFFKNLVPGTAKLHFAGDTYITIPWTPAYNENGTIGGRLEVTVTLDAVLATNQFVLEDSGNSIRMLHNNTANNRWRSRIFTASNSDNTNFQDANEHVHVMTWSTDLDGDYLIDGSGSALPAQGSSAAGANIIVGTNVTFANGLVGFISDLKHYDSKIVGQGSLIHHWPIDDDNGTVIADVIGGSDGVLTIGAGTWQGGDSFDDQATGVVIPAGYTSPANPLGFDMTWPLGNPIAGDDVDMVYSSGNLLDYSTGLDVSQTYTVPDVTLNGYIENTENAWSGPLTGVGTFDIISNEIQSVSVGGSFTDYVLDVGNPPERIEVDVLSSVLFSQVGIVIRDSDANNFVRCNVSPLNDPVARLWMYSIINGVEEIQTVDVPNGNNQVTAQRLIVTDDGTDITMSLASDPGVVLNSNTLVQGLPPQANTMGLDTASSSSGATWDNLQIDKAFTPLEDQTLRLLNCADTPQESIIAFGSTSSSVIYQDSLTLPPSNGLEIGTGVTFDTNGMNTNDTGAWQFNFSLLDFSSLDTEGQFSIEIPSVLVSDYIDRIAGSSGCLGRQPGEWSINDYLCTWASDGTLNPVSHGRLMISSASAPAYQHSRSDVTPFQNMRCTDQGADLTKIFTYSWDATDARIYINGGLFATAVHGVAIGVDIFKFFNIGNDRTRVTPAEILSGGQQIKNFIIANRKVGGQPHRILQKIVAWGDSFSSIYGNVSNQSYNQGYDQNVTMVIEGQLTDLGWDSDISSRGVGGTFLSLTSGGTDMESQVPLVVADNPTIVIFQGLTNDCNRTTGFDIVEIESQLKTHFTTILNGTCEYIYICTVAGFAGLFTSDTPAKQAQIQASNDLINTLTSWDNRVRVVGLNAATGGISGDLEMFMGGWNSGDVSLYGLDLHLSSKGRLVNGNIVADAIIKDL